MKKLVKNISVAALFTMLTLGVYVSANSQDDQGLGGEKTCYFDRIGGCDSGGHTMCGLGYCD
jgi:hypothetical protein